MAHVRLTVSRFPGERPTYGAACVTCGIHLIPPTKAKVVARWARRTHESAHAKGGS